MTDPETIAKWEEFRRAVMEFKRMMAELEFPNWPGPKPDPFATMKLQAKIFDNTKTAMVFSQSMAKIFKETSIELEDDETFACIMFVVKKPTRISEVMDPTPEPSMIPRMLSSDSSVDFGFPFAELTGAAWRPLCYIMEPVIMEAVMERMKQDKINYK